MNFDYWRKGKLQGTIDKVLLINEYPVEFVVHVRNDWPELRDVLDKALEAMPEDESSAIINRWSTVRFEHGIRPSDIAKWGLIFLVSAAGIIFLFVFWNRTLKRRVSERTAELSESESRFRSLFDHGGYAMSLTSGEAGIISMVNQKWLTLFGFSVADEVIGKSVANFVTTEERSRISDRAQ
jgi:PAS domain-containing protein